MVQRRTARLRGITLSELLVVIIVIVVIVVMFGHFGHRPNRRAARRMQNAAQIRGFHQGEIFFAQGNNGWFTGFDRNGKLEADHVFNGEPQTTNWSGDDQSTPRAPAWRFRRMLENGYFAPEYCVSPSEAKPYWKPGEALDPGKFSFAMLKIEGEADSPRKREHRETSNSSAIVVSDRAIRNGSGYKSVHTNPADPNAVDWQGNVGWGDGHVSFESAAVLDTQYDQVVNENDNLFTDSNPSGAPNAEAAMAWKSAGDTDAELVE